MATTPFVFDLIKLYEKSFGETPVISDLPVSNSGDSTAYQLKVDTLINLSKEKEYSSKGTPIKEQFKGVEIFLPTRINDTAGNLLVYLPYCIVNISGKKNIIETSLSGRIGSVKELYNIDDYKIGIKGFLIGENRKFPEEQIDLLRKVYELQYAVSLSNAITDVFLLEQGLPRGEQGRVVISSIDFPEVQGGREHVKPFSMQLSSDIVFTLELED